MDIDKRMNVFFIDGSEKVYVWNQYWNDVGVDSVVKIGTFLNIKSGDSIIVGADTDDWKIKLNSSEWNLIQIEWSVDNSLIDSLLDPHIFFDGGSPYHVNSLNNENKYFPILNTNQKLFF